MRRLFKNISWILGANLFVAFNKWLILILIARILMPEDLGVYSLAFALTAPIALLVNFKLRDLLVTEKTPLFKKYSIVRNITSLFALLIMVVTAILFYPSYLWVIILVGTNKILDLHSELYYSLPHLKSDFDIIGKLMIIKHLLILISFFIAVLVSKDLVTSLIIQLIVQIIVLVSMEKKKLMKLYSPKIQKEIKSEALTVIKTAFPLGLSMMLVSLTANIPKYILEYVESPESLGYFTAISYVLVVGNLVMKSISQNFLPKLTKIYRQNNQKLFKKYVFLYLTGFSLLLGSCLVLGTFLFGELFLGVVYGNHFIDFFDIFLIGSFAMVFNFIGWNFDTGLMSIRSINVQPIISIITMIFSIFFGIILIVKFGIYGAAYTMLLINILQALLRFVFLEIEINKKFKE